MFFTRPVKAVVATIRELVRIYNAPPPNERPPRAETMEQLLLMPLLDKLPKDACVDFVQSTVDMLKNQG